MCMSFYILMMNRWKYLKSCWYVFKLNRKHGVFFNSLSEDERYNHAKWIYSAKTDLGKEDRIAKTLDKLVKKQKC